MSTTIRKALERLSAAAAVRDNVMGDPCALLAAKAELSDANRVACAELAKPQAEPVAWMKNDGSDTIPPEMRARMDDQNRAKWTIPLVPAVPQAQPAPAPDGWVMVPREPTQQILYAMAECDGWWRDDRDHPMLTKWADYWHAAITAAPNAPAVASDMVLVTRKDANAYCRILTALGMEEEGDPVNGVRKLIESAATAVPEDLRDKAMKQASALQSTYNLKVDKYILGAIVLLRKWPVNPSQPAVPEPLTEADIDSAYDFAIACGGSADQVMMTFARTIELAHGIGVKGGEDDDCAPNHLCKGQVIHLPRGEDCDKCGGKGAPE